MTWFDLVERLAQFEWARRLADERGQHANRYEPPEATLTAAIERGMVSLAYEAMMDLSDLRARLWMEK